MHLIFSTFFIRRWAILWLCSVPLLTQAQTGPGGVGNSSSNKVWLKADAGITNPAANTPISLWADQSGNSNHATQPLAAQQPLLQTAQLNGLPALRFDGLMPAEGGDVLGLSSIPAQNTFTQFIIARSSLTHEIDPESNSSVTGVTGQRYLLGPSNYGESDVGAGISMGSNGISSYEHGNAYMPPLAVYNGAVTGFGTIALRYSSRRPSLFLNGTLVRTGLVSPRNNNINAAIWLGGDLAYGHFAGDIAEVIVYNTDLNDAQRIIVENYLSAKYNLPIANDYYTSHTPAYTQDVQGIGTTDGTLAHKHAQAENGKGLLLAERNGSLNAGNEFLLAGHASPANAMVSSDLPSGMLQRWQRDWYLEKRGTLEAKLSFDISEAGLSGSVQSANTYRLLYRSNSSGSFREVSSNGAALLPAIENGDQLVFILPDALLNSGYYTLGVAASTLVWTGAQDGEWNQRANWNLGRVPAVHDQVVVNACSTCPRLNSPVSVAGLQLNSDSRLNLQGYSLSVGGGVSLTQAQVQSSQGTLRAVDFTEVKNCRFRGDITLEKTGGSLNTWYGGNQFAGKVKLVNVSSSSWQVSNTADNLVQSP